MKIKLNQLANQQIVEALMSLARQPMSAALAFKVSTFCGLVDENLRKIRETQQKCAQKYSHDGAQPTGAALEKYAAEITELLQEEITLTLSVELPIVLPADIKIAPLLLLVFGQVFTLEAEK